MTDLRDQLQASLGSNYVIERELGGGGMSRVFVASETQLGRRVVVKVLPAELAGSVSLARFQREVLLAARLQHPHIVPVLGTGEIDGLPYYIMPFVDGESLRGRLSHGELSIAEEVSVLRDVARALAFAHGKGVAHRDIKPDNVLLAGSSAVITDFGVAKAITDASAGGALTSIGIALGTPAYMAPEQAAADPATDLRADIYAFGAMAFETLSGHPPFAGRSAQGMLAAHATEAPPSIGALRPAIPASLATLVMHCLEKRPADRPQTADDVLRVLESVPTADTVRQPAVGAGGGAAAAASPSRTMRSAILLAAASVAVILVLGLALWRMRPSQPDRGAIRSIAVLPFENLSRDTMFAYLEDGITDHVRDALNAIPALTVKARSSSRLMKGSPPREIGSRLGVGAVLQGTVNRSGSRLSVTAELVRASDDAALWSGTFDGVPHDLVRMQDTITRAVAGALHLSGTETNATRSVANGGRGTGDNEAYTLFLQGHYAADHNDFNRAARLFREAIARDPRFALAHAYLALSYAGSPTLGSGSVDSLDALAQASIGAALAIDSTLAAAYAARAVVLGNDMRAAESLVPLERALTLDSTNADIIATYGGTLGQVGRVDEGVAQARRAARRDPLSGTALGLLSYALELSRQYDAAIAELRAALELDPRSVIMHQSLGFYHAFNHRPDSAVAAFEMAFKLNPTQFGGRSNLVFGYAVAGRWTDAARERALASRETAGNSPNYREMVAALAFGEGDAAMAALERGVAAREPLLAIVSIPCDPLFDPLKNNPRYLALLRRLGARACPASGAWPVPARPPRAGGKPRS